MIHHSPNFGKSFPNCGILSSIALFTGTAEYVNINKINYVEFLLIWNLMCFYFVMR